MIRTGWRLWRRSKLLLRVIIAAWALFEAGVFIRALAAAAAGGNFIKTWTLSFPRNELAFFAGIGPGVFYAVYRWFYIVNADGPEACWLRHQPWKNNDPLPRGPARLTLFDLGVLMIFGGLMTRLGGAFFTPFFAFTVFYALSFTNALSVFDMKRRFALIELGIGSFLFVLDSFWGMMALSLALWGVINEAMSVYLEKIRRGTHFEKSWIHKNFNATLPGHHTIDDFLKDPGEQDSAFSRFVRAFIPSFYIAGITRIVQPLLKEQSAPIFGIGYGLGLLILSGTFWAQYKQGRNSPTSIAGRIASGRLFIRGMDYIWMRQIALLVTGAILPFALSHYLALTPWLWVSLSAFSVLFLFFHFLRDKKKWLLTGSFRFTGKGFAPKS